MCWAIATRFDLAQGDNNKIYILCDWVKIQVENCFSKRICSVYVQFHDDKYFCQYIKKYRKSSS